MVEVTALYNIDFIVDGIKGSVSYDNHGIPRTSTGIPGWFKAPVMVPQIARELDGKTYPVKITYESWKKAPIDDIPERKYNIMPVEDKIEHTLNNISVKDFFSRPSNRHLVDKIISYKTTDEAVDFAIGAASSVGVRASVESFFECVSILRENSIIPKKYKDRFRAKKDEEPKAVVKNFFSSKTGVVDKILNYKRNSEAVTYAMGVIQSAGYVIDIIEIADYVAYIRKNANWKDILTGKHSLLVGFEKENDAIDFGLDVLRSRNISISNVRTEVEEFIKLMRKSKNNDFSQLDKAVDEILSENPSALYDFNKGKLAALGILIGMVKEKNKSSSKIIRERLEIKIRENRILDEAVDSVIDEDPEAIGYIIKEWHVCKKDQFSHVSTNVQKTFKQWIEEFQQIRLTFLFDMVKIRFENLEKRDAKEKERLSIKDKIIIRLEKLTQFRNY